MTTPLSRQRRRPKRHLETDTPGPLASGRFPIHSATNRMADDLNKPLLGAGKRSTALTPGGIILTVLAVLTAGVAIWVILGADLSTPPETETAEAEDGAADAGPGEVVIRTPGADAAGVTITTPGGANVDGNGPELITLAGDQLVLSPRPLSPLIETGPYGLVPKMADDGQRPFDAYARPIEPLGPQAVRIAIVVGGVGINAAGSELALSRLPGAVSLALAPYGADLSEWAARARQAGHELLLQLPLEPVDYPLSDPGPHTLLAGDTAGQNVDRMLWLMSRFTTYAGIMTYAGGGFLDDTAAMAPVVAELEARGLMLLDDGTVRQSRSGDVATGVLPFARADMVLDLELSAGAVAAKLAELEALARQRGYAVASASAFPVTIEQIAIWAQAALQAGIVLVPVTSLANDPLNDAVRIEIE